MRYVHTLLCDCNLDPAYPVTYARETMDAIRYRDWFSFRDATRRFMCGSYDEVFILLCTLRVYGGFVIADYKGAGAAMVVNGALFYWRKIHSDSIASDSLAWEVKQ
jgi:hypothetical protein